MNEDSVEESAADWVDIEKLVPWAENPRKNDGAVIEVRDSIKRFGFSSPIIARKADGMVIAGHTRLRAALELGFDRVPVRYMDLDPADARLLALADNKLNERADWDEESLANIMRELEDDGVSLEGLGWDQSELDALLEDVVDTVELDAGDDLGELTYRVVVECNSEQHQATLLEQLEGEGLTCQALIS